MIRPIRVAFHGVSGAGLRTRVLPIARMGPILFRMISNGKFHGVMTPTTPMGSFHTSRAAGVPMPNASLSGSERFQANSLIMSAGQRQRFLQRHVELRAVGAQHRAADLGNQLAANVFTLGLQRRLQLSQACGPGLAVAGPVGVVERVACRGDGAFHVRAGAVGGAADDFLGGGVDVVELASGLGVDELAVDEHA